MRRFWRELRADLDPVFLESLVIFLICLALGIATAFAVVYIFGGLP